MDKPGCINWSCLEQKLEFSIFVHLLRVGNVGVVEMEEDLVVVVLSVQVRFKSIGAVDFTEGSVE